MTKIKILADRVIFDGHAETREECETITLLCDSLANNPNFKTVRYEIGYAEFEKVGKAEKLKFVPAIGILIINFDSHISKVVLTSPQYPSGTEYEWTTSGQELELVATDGQVGVFTATLESGYVIDSITYDTDYATLDEKTDTSFTITTGNSIWGNPITITSKQGGVL